MKNWFTLLLIVILGIISLFGPICKVRADKGMIPVIPNISVYEPGQKAIIGWNGEREILILSTDVYSSQETKVLEILPLPSSPERIEKGGFDSFKVVNELIFEHIPKQGYGEKGTLAPGNVTVLFKTKIGVHDITVVEAKDPEELAYWIRDFLKKNGLKISLSLGSAEQIIDDYTSAGFRHFVLDIIEVCEDKSVEPILYEFKTPFLYYPLKISGVIPGETRISLFLITTEKIDEKLLFESSMQMAYYQTGRERAPIQFKVSLGEIGKIDLRLTDLFEEEAWFTAVFYEGEISLLTKDLKVAYSPQIEEVSSGLFDVSTEFIKGVLVGAALSLLAILSGLCILRELRKAS